MKRHLLNWIFWRLIICSGLLSSVFSSLAQAQPALTSFSPASGPIGTTVTIVGTGFNTTLACNVVFFGATRATVKSVVGAGDLDNNGKTDLIVASTAASKNAFVLRNTSIPGFAPYQTFSAVTSPGAAGTITLSATIPRATTSQLITIYKVTPTLTITSAGTLYVDNVLTAMVSSTVASDQGGTITFGIAVGSGSAIVNSSTGLIRAIGAGTITLSAVSAGDADYYSDTVSKVSTINSMMMAVNPVKKTSAEKDPSFIQSPTALAPR